MSHIRQHQHDHRENEDDHHSGDGHDHLPEHATQVQRLTAATIHISPSGAH